MTTLASETWTGTTGAAWPAQWTTSATAGTAAHTIQANAGEMAVSGSGLIIGRAYLSGMPASVNMDETVSALIPATGAGWLLVVVGSDNGLGYNNFFPTLGYACQVNYDGAGGGTLGLYRCPTSGSSDAFLSAKAMAAGTRQYIRVQRIGSVVRCKVWAASGTEPATWDLTYTDPAPITTAGRLLLSLASNAGNRTTTWDDLVVTDGATGRLVDRWSGSALVPQRVDRWSGSALVPLTSTT